MVVLISFALALLTFEKLVKLEKANSKIKTIKHQKINYPVEFKPIN